MWGGGQDLKTKGSPVARVVRDVVPKAEWRERGESGAGTLSQRAEWRERGWCETLSQRAECRERGEGGAGTMSQRAGSFFSFESFVCESRK